MLKTLAVFATLITFGTTNKLQAGTEKGACASYKGFHSVNSWEEDVKSAKAKFVQACTALTYPSDEHSGLLHLGPLKTNEDGTPLMKKCHPFFEESYGGGYFTCSSQKSIWG